MSLETPDRIHAAAVCFWEVTDAGAGEFAVGYLSRHNFTGPIVLPDGAASPEVMVLAMTTPIAKARALPLLSQDLQCEMGEAGISVGPLLVPIGAPFEDDLTQNNVVVAELGPPDRLDAIGDRALFYVMVLEISSTEEGA